MSAPLNATSSSPQTPANGSRAKFKVKLSSQSKSDWLAGSLTTAKLIAAGAECIPFPYVKGVFGMVIIILETVEKVKRNRGDLKELCEDIVEIISIVQGRLSSHADTTAVEFRRLCEKLEGVLEDVLQSIKKLPAGARGLRSRFKEVMKLGSTADEIAGYRMRIQKLQSNFMLMATIDTNLQVHKGFSTGRLPDSSATPATQSITKCPPPSRIFHGRQNILDKMHQFFTQDLNNQHIFLLYGLGGAGKTQISLKFIEECSSRFTDIFLIDASTTETIDTGLKNIAATRNAGSTAQEALEWLSSKPAEWLLFFDNADDPRINLNKFFPHCKHGNILITSRNPRLRAYAGSHSPVSDMEEPDAVALLLKSCAEEITPRNKELATDIVKALYYLPLAIIQAGAFILKSGALSSYLNLYSENQARLLNEQLDQSHDGYTQTVYTTWQISFERLSKPAATILQLCSFLHHKGISEEIFSRASSYHFRSNVPSEDELHDPLEFLSQFYGPTGIWSSLQFMDVMNEITAYSLATFDPDGKLYSIHPLVHDWSRSTLTDKKGYHYWMVAIVGRSISGIPDQDVQLASLKLLPHVDSLLRGNMDISPDFRFYYGQLYYYANRLKDAEQLYLAVLEHPRSNMGEDNLDMLHAMGALASIYSEQGKCKEAEELEVVVLEKQRKILGEDHPETLRAMGNLASTYHNLGKLQEAEELEVVVLEKQRKILGEDHPNTLWTMGNLAWTYHQQQKLQEAEDLEVVVLEKRRTILGGDHPDTLRAMGNLASTYHNLRKLKEAEELYIELLDRRTSLLGPDHPSTSQTANYLARTRMAMDKKQQKSAI
ncbi:P-loop containing nucleoside triphosphate hydrolase protein [Mycena vulgaris]|nr:P-loop containing nucleoside triphosphate hydrolase protein [Mycena vulgaris]